MSEQNSPIQKILFGSPGTGKSYQIRGIAENQLGIPFNEDTQISNNIVKTVFHPEYTYADFIGKLLPLTQGDSVTYKFYPGHFLRVLGMAYSSLINGSNENYLLIIDELNRGNAAAIFGNIFQLLDRENDGWSSYETNISEMELFGLLTSMELNPIIHKGIIEVQDRYGKVALEQFCERKEKELSGELNKQGTRIISLIQEHQINIPPNLSIIATINTSDESIYYLDSAFKRRWDWEYVESPSIDSLGKFPKELSKVLLVDKDRKWDSWYIYIIGINEFIKSNSQTIRRIEDKQIGWWFIQPKDGKVELQQVKDKLMFYLWDSVFSRDKKPLEDILSNNTSEKIQLVLYSDFLKLTESFLEKMHKLSEEYHDLMP